MAQACFPTDYNGIHLPIKACSMELSDTDGYCGNMRCGGLSLVIGCMPIFARHASEAPEFMNSIVPTFCEAQGRLTHTMQYKLQEVWLKQVI